MYIASLSYVFTSVFWTPNEDPATFTNFFADVRAAQLREMQQVVAAEEGTMFFDFGHVWEGYQSESLSVFALKRWLISLDYFQSIKIVSTRIYTLAV